MPRILILLLLPYVSAAPPTPAQVDQVFERWDHSTSPGCALSVIRDGRIVYARGYGMADLDHDIALAPESVFHVASMSKQFTAASIVLLAQEGKLSLDDEIHKYLPELPDFGSPITIRHLIHHTSGLRDQWELLDLAGWRYSLDLITDTDVLRVMERQKALNFPPGEKHLYCNTGYTLLAQIVKRVSGQSFREFTAGRIFRPLGMRHTHFRDDHAEIVRHQAYGYVRAGDTFRLSVTNFDTVGATSLLTTVEDLALWDQNFYEPRVGGERFIQQMLQPGTLNSGQKLDYAFGLTLGKYRGLPTVDHSGSDAGYRSDLLRFPEQHFSVACLCNLGETNPSQLTRKVADLYLAKDFKAGAPASAPAEKTIPLTTEQLEKYAGFFWNWKDERSLRVSLRDGKLLAKLSRAEEVEMNPMAADRFRLARPQAQLSFMSTRAGGQMTARVQIEGADQPAVYESAVEFHPTPAQLNEYLGTYGSEEIEPLYRIVVEKGALAIDRLKRDREPLRPEVQDVFQGSRATLHFERDAAGRVTGFKLNAGRIVNFQFTRTGASR